MCESLFNLNTKRYTIFVSIYCNFSPLIIFTKSYLYLIYKKRVKFTDRLTKHLNACKDHLYPKLSHKLLWHKSYNKKDDLSRNWKDESDLLTKMVTTTTPNGTSKILTDNTPQKGLFTSKSLLMLKEKWFSSYEFLTGISISDKKYKYLRSKYHKNSFDSFNDQLNYDLMHYFIKSKITKGNVNKV